MPSDRKQINVRVEPDTELLIERLIPAVRSRLGLPISQSDLIRLALQSLAREYLTEEPEEEAPPRPRGKPRRGK
jgi:hypothetical protein